MRLQRDTNLYLSILSAILNGELLLVHALMFLTMEAFFESIETCRDMYLKQPGMQPLIKIQP